MVIAMRYCGLIIQILWQIFTAHRQAASRTRAPFYGRHEAHRVPKREICFPPIVACVACACAQGDDWRWRMRICNLGRHVENVNPPHSFAEPERTLSHSANLSTLIPFSSFNVRSMLWLRWRRQPRPLFFMNLFSLGSLSPSLYLSPSSSLNLRLTVNSSHSADFSFRCTHRLGRNWTNKSAEWMELADDCFTFFCINFVGHLLHIKVCAILSTLRR